MRSPQEQLVHPDDLVHSNDAAELLRLARRAVADPDQEAVVRDAAALALRLLAADLVVVWEVSADGRRLAARGVAGSWPDQIRLGTTMAVADAPMSAYALTRMETVFSEQLAGDRRFPVPVGLIRIGVESAAYVPMAGRQGPVGLICAYTLAPREFARPLLDVLEALADVLGAAFGRRRDEEELSAAEERYRTLVEGAPVCILGIDRTARVDAINEAGLRMMEMPREQAIGCSYLDLVAPADRPRVAMLLSQAFEGRRCEFDFDSADGRRSFSSSFIPLPAPAGETRRLIGVTQDVTARRRTEAQVRRAHKMEALGRLAGGVAHDFNNLVTAISGYAQLARDALPHDRERAARDLDAVAEAAALAGNLTRQLLDFSRGQVLETRLLDAAAVVAGMDGVLRRLVGGAVRLRLETEEDRCWVDGDRAGLEQVVLNLAVNARDAMPDGGDLLIRCVRADGAVRLTVSDTGTGIDEATRARLFEPFFTTKDDGRGTGLGLATVYTVIDALGGSISVESEPGEGSTFVVELPAVPVPRVLRSGI